MAESAAEPADTETPARTFPTDDALCEHCGYPLKGLSSDADCPECGLAVAESSPAKRDGDLTESCFTFGGFWATALHLLLNPKPGFRRMSLSTSHDSARRLMAKSVFYAAIFWSILTPSTFEVFRWHKPQQGVAQAVFYFVAVYVVLYALTYLEVLGVTAVCKRRGWRVDYKLARRVCCYASVGWLPGVLIAVAGAWLLRLWAVGEPWFESLLGLVRVSWLFYLFLFVASLLWFETLVWIGVRQVRYANAWHRAGDRTDPSTDRPPGA